MARLIAIAIGILSLAWWFVPRSPSLRWETVIAKTTPRFESPTTNSLPRGPVRAPVVDSVKASAPPAWAEFARGTEGLAETDQRGFLTLEQRARREIPDRETALYRSISENRPEFARTDFHQSFFTIRELARYGRHPEALLDSLLAPGSQPEDGRRAGHLEPLTEADRLQRLRSYAMREVRERLKREPELAASHSCSQWWKLAAPYAEKDPSLDLAIEATEVLKVACPGANIRRLISTRSERDQRLLSAFVDG